MSIIVKKKISLGCMITNYLIISSEPAEAALSLTVNVPHVGKLKKKEEYYTIYMPLD